MNPYEILKISPNANKIEIILAYHLSKEEIHDLAKEQELNEAYRKAMQNISEDPNVSPYWPLEVPENADEQTITWSYREHMRRDNGYVMKKIIASAYEKAIKSLTAKKDDLTIDINDVKNNYELGNSELKAFENITVIGAEVCNILNKIDNYINENGENKFLLNIRICLLEYYKKVKPYMHYIHNIYKLTAKEYKDLHDFIYDMYTYNIEFTKKLVTTFFNSSKNNLFGLLKYTVEYKKLKDDLEYELDIMRTLIQLDCLIIPLASASDRVYKENPEVKVYGNTYLPVNCEIDNFYYTIPRSEEEIDIMELVSKCLNSAVDKFALSPEKKKEIYAVQMIANGLSLNDVSEMTGLPVERVKYLLPKVDRHTIISDSYDYNLKREKRK